MSDGSEQRTCAIWGTLSVPWMSVNWKWSECGAKPSIPISQPLGVDANTLIQPWNPYQTGSADSRKRLIKLVCKVNGQDYSEEKEAKEFPVTVGDIRVSVKPTNKIDLNFKYV